MSARTLNYRLGLFSILGEIHYSLSLFLAEPLAAAQVPIFQALIADWKTVLGQEIDILEGLATAQAAVNKADDGLDGLAGRVWHVVDDVTGGSASHPLRLHLFAKSRLGKFRRPTLGAQLASMRGWGPGLTGSQSPALATLAGELDPLVAKADAAIALQDTWTQKNREFRDVGARKQLVDKINAARKVAHGELAKLPFTQLGLPSDFADQFFRSDTSPDEVETVDEVQASITEIEGELAARKTLLAKLQQEAAEAAAADAARTAKLGTLTGIDAQIAELKKQREVLAAELKK